MADERARGTGSPSRARTPSASWRRICWRTRWSTARSRRAFEAREKAAQAQEAAMGALNIPSAADVERLTRRLRSVSQRLEGIEDGVDRLDQRLADLKAVGANPLASVDERLAAIEGQLAKLVRGRGASWPALDAAPAPVPREQERLEVDEAPPRAARRARAAQRKKSARPAALGERGERRRGPAPPRRARAPRWPIRSRVGHGVRDGEDARRRPRRGGRRPRSSVAASISTASAPARAHAARARVGVVEEVGRTTRPVAASPAAAAAPRAARGRRRSVPAAPSARLVPSSASDAVGDQQRRRARGRPRARRRSRRARSAARRARSAPRARSRRSGRPCRCSGSSAARRRRPRRSSPTARGCG